ncbi:MAG: PQQ-dependent sugar dehydrogenase [Actinomycetota bacterium]|nr:PQQ-dependent sugar dehydrogenase [Actinomycetota bacterium]
MKATQTKRKGLTLAGVASVAGLVFAPFAGAQQGELPVTTTPFGGSFSSPVHATGAPGYDNLLFVTEQGGTVRVVRDGVQLQEPFLDISDAVTSGGEQGLLSIAFPDDFAQSGRFYAYFTNRDCNSLTNGCNIEVAEFKRKGDDPTDAREGSRRTVIEIPHQEAGNHNGGTAAFGPDGKLWLATGDGGGGNDAFNNASRKNELLGKLLRINPKKPKGDSKRGYRVPRSNPFVGKPGRNEIWSIGLRNPFRFSFDSKKIAIGDVGQNKREEVDIVSTDTAKGADFGWPAREGAIEGPHPERATNLPLIEPIHDYPRPVTPPDSTFRGVSVIGGVFVRDPRLIGTAFDPANDRYLFGEAFTQPTVRSLLPDIAAQTFSDLRSHPFGIGSVAGVGEDAQDRVYIVSLNGTVHRLDPAP